MAAFDLRKTLKLIDPTLRKELFCSSWPHLTGLPWGEMKKAKVDILFEALQQLSMEHKRDVQRLLKTFLRLKSKSGLKVLLDEVKTECPEKAQEWAAQRGPMDKVVWTYLNVRSAFEEAVIFARADQLSATRYCRKWTGPSSTDFRWTAAREGELSKALIDHYSQELRGEICQIHQYSRGNGAEYFFAYLPDWPDNFMVFNQSGELAPLDVPTAFTILFVYTPATGVLETIAHGGLGDQMKLRQLFYKAVCGQEVEDVDPERPTYQLDHVLQDGFAFGVDAASLPVDRVDVVRLLVFPIIEGYPIEGIQLRLRPGLDWQQALARLDKLLASQNLTRDQVTVDEIWIRVRCTGDGKRRGRTIPIRVTPRACDLKSQDDDQLRVIGETCLRLWEIDRDRPDDAILGGDGSADTGAEARGLATSSA